MSSEGQLGWARKADLDGRLPASPADALAQQSGSPRSVPVFDVEEEGVIGSFIITGGSGGVGRPPRSWIPTTTTSPCGSPSHFSGTD